jgi:hypothetical protein
MNFLMVSADELYRMHHRLCDLKDSAHKRPLGNISFILSGDLLQLKPVKAQYIFQPPNNKEFENMYKIFNLWEMFDCIELKENHRQGENESWADTLNRLRFKRKDEDLSPEDFAALNS